MLEAEVVSEEKRIKWWGKGGPLLSFYLLLLFQNWRRPDYPREQPEEEEKPLEKRRKRIGAPRSVPEGGKVEGKRENWRKCWEKSCFCSITYSGQMLCRHFAKSVKNSIFCRREARAKTRVTFFFSQISPSLPPSDLV